MQSSSKPAPRRRSAVFALTGLLLGALSMACAPGSLTQCRADTLNYTVSLDTSFFPAATSGYNLDFALINGSGTGASAFNQQSVTASNFSGGTASGPSTVDAGGASGNATSGFSLTDSAFRNEVFQGFNFTPANDLSFNLAVVTGGAAATNQDVFSFYIFDNTNPNPTFVPTDGPSNALFTITFDSLSNPTITSYTTSPAFGSVSPTVTPVPEPTSLALMLAGLGSLAVARRKRRQTGEAAASPQTAAC